MAEFLAAAGEEEGAGGERGEEEEGLLGLVAVGEEGDAVVHCGGVG